MFGTLFSTEMPLALRFIIAFVVVLALIGIAAWVVRRFGANRLGSGAGRGRQQPRLAVIDAANVDGRRRLVLIRRDNIEHLLMIGGPSDVVVEANIVRAVGLRESPRDPGRLAPVDTGWPLQPIADPAPRVREENWTAPEPLPRAPEPLPRSRAGDNLAGLPADFSGRLAPDVPHPAPPRTEPRAPAPQTDPLQDAANLAEMAQQLEAALRRPIPVQPTHEPKPVELQRPGMKMRIDPRIESRAEPKIEPVKFEKPAPRVAEPKPAPRVEPKAEARPEPKAEPKAEPKVEAKPEPRIEPKADIHVERSEPKPAPKSEPAPEVKPDPMSRQDFYDNLEEEMASLLGRPTGKS
jgi:hypothetical protein